MEIKAIMKNAANRVYKLLRLKIEDPELYARDASSRRQIFAETRIEAGLTTLNGTTLQATYDGENWVHSQAMLPPRAGTVRCARIEPRN